MPSLKEAVEKYGMVEMDHEDLVVVHLLLFNMTMDAPTVADAKAWSDHFGYANMPNHLVLAGDSRMLGGKTMSMVPGLQLVDREFNLRFDSAGNSAPNDLWTELMPAIRGLLVQP